MVFGRTEKRSNNLHSLDFRKMNIQIQYDGAYPNLCSGRLVVIIDGKYWDFEDHSLRSGGNVWFDDDWTEHVEDGPWSVSNWPEDFPEHLKEAVEEEINSQISQGCCGGCV